MLLYKKGLPLRVPRSLHAVTGVSAVEGSASPSTAGRIVPLHGIPDEEILNDLDLVVKQILDYHFESLGHSTRSGIAGWATRHIQEKKNGLVPLW